MGSKQWRFQDKPYPSLSLLFIPMFISLHFLISIILFFFTAFLLKSPSIIIFWIFFVIIIFLFRNVYLRLFFNFFIWFLKQNGKKKYGKIVLRTLKYSILTFVLIPLILFISQALLESKNFSEVFWFSYIFTNFYIYLGITILISILIEELVPNKIFKKVEKAYSQVGGLMAQIEW